MCDNLYRNSVREGKSTGSEIKIPIVQHNSSALELLFETAAFQSVYSLWVILL